MCLPLIFARDVLARTSLKKSVIVNKNYNYGGVWRENISKCFKLQVTKTREKKKEAHSGLSMRMYLWVYNLEPKLRNRKILPGHCALGVNFSHRRGVITNVTCEKESYR